MSSGFQLWAETYLIPTNLAFMMLGMGATLRVSDFVDLARRPVGLAIGLTLQWIGVPLLAFALTRVLDMSPGWSMGLLLIAVVPGGTISNLLTFVGNGNVPLSISMTVAATIGSILTIPLLLGVLAPSYLPADFTLPTGKIVSDIVFWLLIPLSLGMFARHFMIDDRAGALSKWAIRISLLALAVIVVSSMASGRIEVAAYGWAPPLRLLGFGLFLALGIPHLVRLLGRDDKEALAVGVEVTMRNVGVGLLMFPLFFPGEDAQGHVLYSLLFYSAVSLPACTPALILNRKGLSPAIGRRPRRAAPAPDA